MCAENSYTRTYTLKNDFDTGWGLCQLIGGSVLDLLDFEVIASGDNDIWVAFTVRNLEHLEWVEQNIKPYLQK